MRRLQTGRLLSTIPTQRRYYTQPKMTQYDISITSDIVCPWCYIGHTRLSRAIAQHHETHPADKFNLKYEPFYLNPPPQLTDATAPPFPVKSMPRREMYAQKFGPERARQIEAMMSQTSRGEGLDFKFGGMTGLSRNGHRLVHWAQRFGEEAQNRTMLGLWRRYFEREVDITTLETLVEVGVEAGLGAEAEVKEYLESGRDGVEVDRKAEEARVNGVSGVPNYVINDMWEVSGAQDPRVFTQLFSRYKELEKKGQVGGGDESAEVEKGKGCL